MIDTDFKVAFDLYLLRYVIQNNWFETHDVLRDYLRNKGHEIIYRTDDLLYDRQSMNQIIKQVEKQNE